MHNKTIVMTGGSGGLGARIRAHLQAPVIDLSLDTGVDLGHKLTLELYASHVIEFNKRIDVLLHCAGMNVLWPYGKDGFYENWLHTMQVNTLSFVHLVHVLLPYLKDATVCCVVSNAANIPMTHSSAYNCSKAALAMAVRQMAHELGPRHNITCFGVSPNKLRGTGMSLSTDAQAAKLRGWSDEQARHYQLSKLPTGEETDPEQAAEFIAWLLAHKQRHKYLHGTIIPYGGPQ